MCNRLAAAAIAALVTTGSIAFAADDQPLTTPRLIATVKALADAGAAVPALNMRRSVECGAQAKLARAMPAATSRRTTPRPLPISSRSPINRPTSFVEPDREYAAEAFVALGQYYLDGILEGRLRPTPTMPRICSVTP
jgi:hypothetical protein